MKKLLGLALITASLSACTSSPSSNGTFAQADTNRDGYVSLDEWRVSGGQELAFMAADRDHKGRLNEDQFNEARRLNAGAAGDAQAAQQASDTQITQAVKAALSGQRNLNAWAIRVETYQGSVQLSGTVRTQAEKQQAEDVARGVPGARQVFNSIALQN